MYKGVVQGVATTKNSFLYSFYDSVHSYEWRLSSDVTSSTYIRIGIYPQSTEDTSTGAYLDVYLSPQFNIDSDFNMNNDCRFANVMGTAVCTQEKTSSYFRLTIKSSTPSIVNPFPKQSYTYIYIYNVIPSRSTSAKYIHPCYFTLFKTDAPGATEYYDTRVITVMPKYDGLANVRM
jgi:hypothetical protein